MELQDLETLFRECMGDIPPEDEKKVLNYWKDFEVVPSVLIKQRLDNKAAGQISGLLCLHEISIAEASTKAPRRILTYLIKHEIAHAYDFSKKWERIKGRPVRVSDTLPSDSPFFRAGVSDIRKTEKEIHRSQIRHLDEDAAILINMRWGSDEEALETWISENIERL